MTRPIWQLIHDRIPYYALTQDEIDSIKANGLMNGYGWKDFIGRVINFLIKRLAPTMKEANSDYHDWSYTIGWDELRRLECDNGFYKALIEDSTNTNFKVYYIALSNVMFYMVRKYWHRYFNYR
jgi:hypothetical protein